MATKKKEAEAPVFRKAMQVGLGEAIQRLMRVELMLRQGFTNTPAEHKEEHRLLLEALNTHQLDLGFDCDEDGVPDSIDIFAKSAHTSCCRILPTNTSRSSATKAASSRSSRSAKASSSRKKKTV